MAESTKAAKERIIKHMNAEHQGPARASFDGVKETTDPSLDSLIRYLEHFCHLSSFSARHARLERVTLNSLSISSGQGGKLSFIPIQPAMRAWSESRTRFADLDAQAIEALGRSNITVKKYTRPRGFLAVVFVSCCLTYISFFRRSNFQPGSLLYDALLRHVDGFARFCFTIQPVLICTMVVLHLGEAIYMARTRLRKHNVPTLSRLWWTWVLSTFIEGKGAFIRIDRIVKVEEEKKANSKY